MELKVGDYVRTKYGIAKYIDDEAKSLKLIVIDRNIAYDHMDSYENVISRDEIIKSNSNIMRLIQVGDYVNGKEIIQIIDNELYFDTNDMSNKISFKEKDIKTIVTKEQFEQMEYKIGEDE